MSDARLSAEEELVEKYPHYKTYKACQSHAFMSSSFTFVIASACSYFAIDTLYRRFKANISKNWLTAGPIVFGILSAYVVVQRKTTNCQNMWMAMEERHSVLTPASERAAIRQEKLMSSPSSQ
ncbi:hypothetical protein Btru_010200 [Bulinus truncatus]|nr:hypothetical protein Btru_010200 [Bulinus truncatus]